MTIRVIRNEEMVLVPFDQLTIEECDYVAWRTEQELWSEVWAWIMKQNDAYTEEEE